MPFVVFESNAQKSYLDADRARALVTAASVTPVPTAPAVLVGVTQIAGEILCVLDPAPEPRPLVRPGDPLLVVERGEIRAVLAVDRVLGIFDEAPAGVSELDLEALFDRVRAQVESA